MKHPPDSHRLANQRIAAAKIGCDLDTYLANRAAGLSWCGRCRKWLPRVFRNWCTDCRRDWRREAYGYQPHRQRTKPANDTKPPHPPQRWCSCEWCVKARAA